jgi:diguanylate cyclase (GGDEF)-like protein/PAS domain S-box-containing protein
MGIFNPRQDDYTWLLVNAVPQFHAGETTPYQVCATFDNFTARKQRDDALAILAAIVDASEDAIVGKTVDGTIVSWNATATRLYGYTAAESIGQPISILVPPEQQAELAHVLERIGRGERIAPFETVRCHKDGTALAVSLTVTLLTTAAGQIIGVADVARDITARRAAEALLRASEERFQAQYQGSPIPILIWQAIDGEFVLKDVNRAALAFTHGGLRAFLGQPASVVYREDAQTVADIARCCAEQVVVHRERWWALSPTGERRFLAVSYAPIAPDIVMLHAVDLTERKQAAEALGHENHRLVRTTTNEVLARRRSDQLVVELQLVNEQLLLSGLREQESTSTATHLAMHDSLTGLPNRLLFLKRLQQALASAPVTSAAYAVMLLDMDRFKAVNDTLGHQAGDDFLQEIARRLSTCVRPADTVARLGGDEFAIVVGTISGQDEALHVAERIHLSLNEPFTIAGKSISSGASIGIVLTMAGYTQPETLLHDCDTALYRAKALGKARSVIFEQTMHDQALALTNLEVDLRYAITREEFRLHYQPIVSLHTGVIVGVEALLRWQHPTRGSIMPGEFLGVLEAAGLMIPVGNWVLRTACTQLRAWHTAGLAQLYVAVNLSARQLQQRDLPATIAEILEQTGLTPQSLHLELTESSAMVDVTASIATLHHLSTHGMRISVDDFGTGYSSLSYLRQLPITTVKIDRSFVDKVATDADTAAITSAIIAMAHRLKLTVIAEGVETEAQLEYLRAEDCDAVQGYLCSPPLPAAALEPLLQGAGRQWPHLPQRSLTT